MPLSLVIYQFGADIRRGPGAPLVNAPPAPAGLMVVKTKICTIAGVVALGWIAASRPVSTHEVVNTTVTYNREIVRIVNKKCVACHSENNLGIPLVSYEQTRPWARAIEEEVLRRHMPP